MDSAEFLVGLKHRLERVTALLSDPHPGLATWVIALDQRMHDVTLWWEGELPAPMTSCEPIVFPARLEPTQMPAVRPPT
jgi:hypothetical protein